MRGSANQRLGLWACVLGWVAACDGQVDVTEDEAAVNLAPATYPVAWDTAFVDGKPVPEDYAFGRRTTILKADSTYLEQELPLPCDVSWERDVPIKLRDGVEIYADLLRPTGDAKDLPALVAWSPYGKAMPTDGPTSVPPDRYSGVAKFEGPDAAFWVCRGYAIVNVDVRGSFRSGGKVHSFGMVDAADGYDVIEWIARQSWSNGNVGMHGASWLAIAEWFIASTNPPHLKAIAPWNGQSDLYRNGISLGGIPDTAFSNAVGSMLISPNGKESTVEMLKRHPLINDYWKDKRANVEDIKVPAYVGADIATALHTTGTLDGFRRLGSPEKWLRVNDTNEWYDQYAPDTLKDLARFFDHYLKEEDNGWEDTPQVTVSIMDPGPDGAPKSQVPYDAWPVPDTRFEKLYLDASDGSLSQAQPKSAADVTYEAKSGKAEFTIRFEEDTQLVGHLVAQLYLEARDVDDMDVFVLVEKLDRDGNPLVPSELAAEYFPKPPPGAPGRLRVSRRALDADKSSEDFPVHAFTEEQKLSAGEIVPVEIAIMPTALRWHAGEQLKLTVAGTYIGGSSLPIMGLHEGIHVVHTGPEHAAYLQIPVVPWTP
ncbi:MAG: CocE/NonD family hydrolase [Polyangiales bacterium]